jgi:hypothetical protein
MRRNRRQYLKYREEARTLVKSRIVYFNVYYNHPVGKVFIKNHKSRWGSCSSKGNLNFNYKIVLLPPEIADYIIVHELCHLKQFNHSPQFWSLVAETVPNHKVLRQKLRAIERVPAIFRSVYKSGF